MTKTARPRQDRRLVRTPDLAGFRSALVELAWAGDPLQARRRVLILPTRASIELFRQTMEAAAAREGRATIVLPELVTRDGWFLRLHDSLPGAPPLLTRLERETILERAARSAATRARMPREPFVVRPGLVGQMLDLYDEIRRRQRTVGRFTSALFDQLRVERGTDRGSESLIHQTCFLGFAFLGYERGVAASGGIDEHQLRRRVLEEGPALSFDEVVVAVADNPTDPRGLWPTDFDLLGRLPLRRIDVVVTDETHDAGFRERMEQELPGIEELRRSTGARALPVRVGATTEAGAPAPTSSRDREEELRDVAREVRRRAKETDHAIAAPTAVVFQRPLPYLYLAQNVFVDAGVPFQAFDALPLAAEPYAALADQVVTAARTGGTRDALVALLRSPLLELVVDDAGVDAADAAALDAVLVERRAVGEADTYPAEVEAFFAGKASRDRIDARRATRAARAAVMIRTALEAYRSGPHAAGQVRAISGFLRRFESPAVQSDDRDRRFRRARAGVLGVLDDLAHAFSAHDNGKRPHENVTAAIHHAFETQTISLEREHRGVRLVDAVAARFGEFDHVHVVGFIEADWPERPRRSIFYSSALLTSLGWPEDRDRTRAEQAAFRDLLGLPARTLQLHAFQVEGDTLAAVSPMIEMARGLATREPAVRATSRVFADEVLTVDPPLDGGLDAESAAWLQNRLVRPPLGDPRYRGEVDAQPPSAYRISKVDRFVACPFKYFSESVLGLPEERDEQAGLTPLERGNLVHELFEQFYRTWHQNGSGTITPETLPAALDLFRQLTRSALLRLPAPDRALEEARLLGSIVARGVAERVFELEADAGGHIVDRLIEHDLRGPFVFPHGFSPKTIQIRGKADRIDIFDDGSLRVIDYKLGKPPDLSTTIQIAVYAHCMKSTLEARDGKPHPIVAASYLAFGDEKNFEGALASRGKVAMEVETRAQEFADVIVRIEAGKFAPDPKKPSDCQWCRYAGVCRKEYQVEDDAAELV